MDNDQMDNDQTDNDQMDNDQTDNDQMDNDQMDNDQMDNDQTDNDQTDNDQLDKGGRVKMGKSTCDDGVHNIEQDLKNMDRDTTCDKELDPSDKTVHLKKGRETNAKFSEEVPEGYSPEHYCMNTTINLNTVKWGSPRSSPQDHRGQTDFPTHAPHRANWASFGEYEYCPPERYQHNIEHGSVVMLYHPCLDKKQVTMVKKAVAGCIRKHIITPSRLPTLEKPVVLIAWGHYQELEFLDINVVKSFIIEHGLGGPEGDLPKDGLYTHLQTHKAKGKENTILCKHHTEKSGKNNDQIAKDRRMKNEEEILKGLQTIRGRRRNVLSRSG